MKKIFSKRSLSMFLVLALLFSFIIQPESVKSANNSEFEGLYYKTKYLDTLDNAVTAFNNVVGVNPNISGVQVGITWANLHPTAGGGLNWTQLDSWINTCSNLGLPVKLLILGGERSPDWIYGSPYNVPWVGPYTVNGQSVKLPNLYHDTYHQLLETDLAAVASRYGNNPIVKSVVISGHTYNDIEMHPNGPSSLSDLAPFGLTPDTAGYNLELGDYKRWIDFFASTFPNQRLHLVISDSTVGTYTNRTNDPNGPLHGANIQLAWDAAQYLYTNYFTQGRDCVLETHALNGRQNLAYDQYSNVTGGSGPLQMGTSRYFANLTPSMPNGHELVSSFITDPTRQGDLNTTVSNLISMDYPLYLQLWQADSQDVPTCESLLSQYYSQTNPAFSDNFESGSASQWTTAGGTWSVVSDNTKVYKQSATVSTGTSYAGYSTWSNYSVEATVKPLSLSSGATVGLSARYTDNNNRYSFLYNSDQGQLKITKKAGGTNTTLNSVNYTINTNTEYTFKAEVNGTTLNFYVNGILQLTAADSSFSSGKIALNSNSATAEFDNVTVNLE